MGKYKVIKNGYYYNGNKLLVGQVIEGIDKGSKFIDKPAITMKYEGKEVSVPKDYLSQVSDDTPITDLSAITKYNEKRNRVKSLTKLAGLGGAVFLAHKMNKGVWGYVGFSILGMITGIIIGNQISNIVIKKPN